MSKIFSCTFFNSKLCSFEFLSARCRTANKKKKPKTTELWRSKCGGRLLDTFILKIPIVSFTHLPIEFATPLLHGLFGIFAIQTKEGIN